ncbi:metallophosphoesterase family protein [Rhizobium multihospitium]|uniref:Predicted phosphodiesterase n=1 Tax=Rhizobium multihospitium TaxID=410764 RepID=A0A1C3XBW6_9HYPH|nr:metallophosphoesterase family protein [Rhizobium multihospitium]SCB49464.1 Predicted phosphodiesterase [Rhizobium multihospitium]
MRIAAISDVHGNRIALEAVAKSIRELDPDIVISLGDLVSGPFDPAGSADLHISLGYETIAGNHERQIIEGGTGLSDSYARQCLSQSHKAWIEGLPKTATFDDGLVFACHGSPTGGDNDYLLEDVSSGRPVLNSKQVILDKLNGIGNAEVVLCGHSHIPRIVYVGGVLVVNPGSIGMPGYRSEKPISHVVEVGAPHARFAFLEKTRSGWSAELRSIPYDFELAALQAEAVDRPAVAHLIRNGWFASD